MKFLHCISKGFTLIELLVVIAVIGTLAGALIVLINPAAILDRARIARGKAFQGNLTRTLGFYSAAEWKFNDASTPGLDSSGNQLTGTLTEGASYTANCDLGMEGCISFDGSNGYVLIADNYAIDIGTGNKTWALWFKTSSSSRGIMYRKSDGSNSNGVLIDINSSTPGQLRCYVSNNGPTVNISVSSTQNTWNDDSWHYLVCVLDRSSNKLSLYTDGKLNNTADSSGLTGDLNAVGSAQIGQGGGFFFSGKIDEFYIFSQSLSQAMIHQLYTTNAAEHMLASLQ